MKIKDILALMYEAEEEQIICVQDHGENVYFLGTVTELRRNKKGLEYPVLTMFTERYNALHGVSGLTIVIGRKEIAQ